MFARFLVAATLALAAVTLSPVSLATAQEHGGAHEHIGAANAGPNLEDPKEFKSDLALFTLVVFLLLLAILWKFAWGPIVASLERREATIAHHISEAERNHEEARKLLADYDRKLAGAAGEVRELMEQARRDGEHVRQSIVAEAKTAAEAERARALHDIESATDQALESLAERSAQLAVDLAGKILQSKLSQDDHARLIQEALAKFPAPSSAN
ncbi:MAG TPA: F0F1 ATP synthase subunit B [Pirellulales bacterium]|nr:F0F1 ATP synthase subunit B [Pirellulales bacterium]